MYTSNVFKSRVWMNVVFMVMMLTASGCGAAVDAGTLTVQAGEVVAVAENATWMIMQNAAAGAPYTKIFTDGNGGWVFAQAAGENWAYVGLNWKDGTLTQSLFRMATGGNGNLVTRADFQKLMEGFRVVSPGAIPALLHEAIMAGGGAFLRIPLPVLMLPLSPTEFFLPEYEERVG